MVLVVYFLAITFVSVGSFWIAGNIYGLFRKKAIYFPIALAVKMALSAVLGGIFLLIGGVVLSTLVFNAEMKKRSDYKPWSTLIVGAVISILCSALIFYSAIFLAWTIFD
ncbi:MAG: hypothetical protein PVG66_03325 [Chromatiales bacterium]|jgi:hypothetical protein